jgi:hypothetical protein
LIDGSKLTELLKMYELSSEGPWKSSIEGRDHSSGDNVISTKDGEIYLLGASHFDQDLIATMHNYLPILIDEIKWLRQREIDRNT